MSNICEACNAYIQTDDKGRRTAKHHIVSRGAGGTNNPENLMSLCVKCHRAYHQIGRLTFTLKYPHLKEKVLVARAAGGKKIC